MTLVFFYVLLIRSKYFLCRQKININYLRDTYTPIIFFEFLNSLEEFEQLNAIVTKLIYGIKNIIFTYLHATPLSFQIEQISHRALLWIAPPVTKFSPRTY